MPLVLKRGAFSNTASSVGTTDIVATEFIPLKKNIATEFIPLEKIWQWNSFR